MLRIDGERLLLKGEALAAPAKSISSGTVRIAILVFVADLIALQLALLLGVEARTLLAPWFPISISPAQYWGLAQAVLVATPIYALFDLYPGYAMSGIERFRRRVLATSALFVLLLLVDHLHTRDVAWSRGALLCVLVAALPTVLLADRLLRAALVRLGAWGKPVLLLGAGRTGSLVARRLHEKPRLGLLPVAFFDDDPQLAGRHVEGVPVMGSLSGARAWRHLVDTAVVCVPSLPRERLHQLVRQLDILHITVVPDLIGMQSLWVRSRDLGGILGLEMRHGLLLPANRALKFMLDYLVALPAFLVSLPIQALAALAIWLFDPGPVLFAQERPGHGGRMVRVWKLRTMYRDAEPRLTACLAADAAAEDEWRRFFKLRDDPRVLPVIGRFLRRTSIDELPQLWNVLRGEMSLVGPRPFPTYHLAAFDAGFLEMRSSVLPGITGFWQVEARSDGDIAVQERLDAYYILNWSLWLDLYILARTLEALLMRRGAY